MQGRDTRQPGRKSAFAPGRARDPAAAPSRPKLCSGDRRSPPWGPHPGNALSCRRFGGRTRGGSQPFFSTGIPSALKDRHCRSSLHGGGPFRILSSRSQRQKSRSRPVFGVPPGRIGTALPRGHPTVSRFFIPTKPSSPSPSSPFGTLPKTPALSPLRCLLCSPSPLKRILCPLSPSKRNLYLLSPLRGILSLLSPSK